MFGIVDGTNKRGRSCREWMDDIFRWCKTGLQELNSLAQDHRRWKLITRQAMNTNGRWSHGSLRRRRRRRRKIRSHTVRSINQCCDPSVCTSAYLCRLLQTHSTGDCTVCPRSSVGVHRFAARYPAGNGSDAS